MRRRGAQITWLSLKTKVSGLSMVWPQNHWDGLSVVWTQNYWDGFSQFGLKTGGDGFPCLDLKAGSYSLMIYATKSPWRFLGLGLKAKWATVCRLHHKNRREDEDGAGHISRSSGLLHMEASQAMVSQSGLKTSGGVMTDGACGTIAEVA
jgi:hypothetical protein